jgi:hypothetical protein
MHKIARAPAGCGNSPVLQKTVQKIARAPSLPEEGGNLQEQRRRTPIVISYEKDEYMPLFLGYSHNLKEKNLAYYDHEKIGDAVYRKSATLGGKSIVLTLTYDGNFVQGTIAVCPLEGGGPAREHSISNVCTYNSLQIGEYCYDNISVVKIVDETFTL